MQKASLVIASALVWAAIGLLTAATSLAEMAAVLLCGWWDRQRRLPHGMSTVWGLLIVRLVTAGGVTVQGRRHLPRGQAAVLVANHQSQLDIMALYALRCPFKWVAKAVLFRVPFLGWAMRSSGYLQLERGQHGSIRDTYAQVKRYLAGGMPVLFFPEGTRSRTGEMLPFKNGAFRVAQEMGVPVVPIALRGTRDLLVRGSWLWRLGGRVRLTVLEPISTKSYAPDEAGRLRDEARRRIADALAHD